MSDLTRAIKDNISITAYAALQGYDVVETLPGRRWGLAEHDSVVITPDPQNPQRQRFYWNSRQQSGSVIDFAMALKNITADEAISELRLQLHEKTVKEWKALRPAQTEKAAAKEFAPPPKGTEGKKRLYAYLCKQRGIEPSIVHQLVQQKMLYQDDKGNAVFLGNDYTGAAQYAFVRGTLSEVSYRKESPGSRKEVGFSMNLVDAAPTKLVVCEAAIDALSFASMLEICGKDYQDFGYLSLGGTGVHALRYHLEHHPQLETIYLCQDNDAAGAKSRAACMELLAEKGFAGQVIEKVPMGKDYNEMLLAMRNEQLLQQQHSEPLTPAFKQPG